MTRSQINDAGMDILRLLSALLTDKPLCAQAVQKMHLQDIFELSKFHGLEAPVYTALERTTGISMAPTLASLWRKDRDGAVRRDILLDIERAELFGFLERCGIAYTPLKGIVLRELYPQGVLRQMTDNDILHDISARSDVAEFFLSRGYTAQTDSSYHDSYVKPPVYRYEMHTSLFSALQDKSLTALSDELTAGLMPEKGYMRRFSDEDFYIYMTAHCYSHYIYGGIGLRALVDCYLFRRSKGDMSENPYVRRRLEKFSLDGFERRFSQLADNALENPDKLTHEQTQMLEYMIFSGAHGTREHVIANRVKAGGGRLGYLLGRIFPGRVYMYCRYPLVDRHRLLLPFAYFYRILGALFSARGTFAAELDAVKKSRIHDRNN